MDLSEALVTVPQAERGGEIAIRGFEYQRYWAIDELLKRHTKNESYVFIPEYHDDILILDSAQTPKEASFVQVKTRDKKWTLTPLIKATEKDKLSYISKLYKHKQDFTNHSVSLMFITNAQFSFHDKYHFCADDLSDGLKTKIIDSIQKQISGVSVSSLTELKFEVSNLSLMDYDVHLVGKVCDIIENNKDIESINPTAFKCALVDLFEKKTRISSREINNFQELINKKGITNDLINNIIDKLKVHSEKTPEWQDISNILAMTGMNNIELIVAKTKFNIILLNLKNKSSLHYAYYNRIREIININTESDEEVIKCLNNVINEIDKENSEFMELLDKNTKIIISCYVFIEKISEEEVEL